MHGWSGSLINAPYGAYLDHCYAWNLLTHFLHVFVANLKNDAIYVFYPESFCDKNLALRKVFVFSDSVYNSAHLRLHNKTNMTKGSWWPCEGGMTRQHWELFLFLPLVFLPWSLLIDWPPSTSFHFKHLFKPLHSRLQHLESIVLVISRNFHSLAEVIQKLTVTFQGDPSLMFHLIRTTSCTIIVFFILAGMADIPIIRKGLSV